MWHCARPFHDEIAMSIKMTNNPHDPRSHLVRLGLEPETAMETTEAFKSGAYLAVDVLTGALSSAETLDTERLYDAWKALSTSDREALDALYDSTQLVSRSMKEVAR